MIYPQKRRESASPQVLKSLHTEATADLVEAALPDTLLEARLIGEGENLDARPGPPRALQTS